MARRWYRPPLSRHRPADPLFCGLCPQCGPRRTSVAITIGETAVRTLARAHCLRCLGCPHCGSRNIVEEYAGVELLEKPITVAGQVVTGDWACMHCSRLLVDWSSYRREMEAWALHEKARSEPGPRRGRPRKVRAA